MLTIGGQSSTYMYNGLKNDFPISKVIIEEKVSKKIFLERRIKKLGIISVIGQVLFQIFIPKILQFTSKNRIEQLKSTYQLDETPIEPSIIKNFTSVNSVECIDFLKKENPDLIIVNGTRIISKKVLNCTKATFINTHAGITPKYRGVYGGYWAIANDDKENSGATVPFADTGIDTGGVLFQEIISTNSEDNFITYTYLQIGVGVQLMKKAVFDFINGNLKETKSQTTESKLWYHPTIWYYLFNRIFRGIK